MAPTYAARRGRNRAPCAQYRQVAADAAAHRPACCPRPARRAARATSDTRTSESRAVPDSANRRRRRILRTTALAGKACASCSAFSAGRERSIGSHLVALTAPVDGTDEEARDVHGEREHIACGTQPPAAPTHAQSMINLDLQDKATGDCRTDDAAAESRRADQPRTEQCERQRMRHDQSRVAPRRHRTQRARPAKLVAEQFAERSLRTAVNHDERRYRDAHAEPAHGFTNRVVVGERIEERFEAADGGERVASKRDRRTEARPCNAEREADQHVRDRKSTRLNSSHVRISYA